MISGTALFTFFFFFFFCSLRCLSSWHYNVQLSLALTGTGVKRVGNNTKLVCASGRQSLIVANHTCIASSILNPLDRLLVFPVRLWGWSNPRGLHHKLQSGGRHIHHLRPHIPLHVLHQRRRGEGLSNRPNLEARETFAAVIKYTLLLML
jgi:hypothetical protein